MKAKFVFDGIELTPENTSEWKQLQDYAFNLFHRQSKIIPLVYGQVRGQNSSFSKTVNQKVNLIEMTGCNRCGTFAFGRMPNGLCKPCQHLMALGEIVAKIAGDCEIE